MTEQDHTDQLEEILLRAQEITGERPALVAQESTLYDMNGRRIGAPDGLVYSHGGKWYLFEHKSGEGNRRKASEQLRRSEEFLGKYMRIPIAGMFYTHRLNHVERIQ